MKTRMIAVAVGIFVSLIAGGLQATVTVQALYKLGVDGYLPADPLWGTTFRPNDSSGNGRDMPDGWGDETGLQVITGGGPLAWPAATTYYHFPGTVGFGDTGNPVTAVDDVGVEIWARVANLSDNGVAALFGTGTSYGPWDGNDWGLNLSWANGGFQAILGQGGQSQTQVGSTYTPATNTWVDLALVRDNGVSTFYVNGVAQGGTAAATPNGYTGGDDTMMSITSGGGCHFLGDLAWARIFTFTSPFSTSDLDIQNTPSVITSIWGAASPGSWNNTGSWTNSTVPSGDGSTAIINQPTSSTVTPITLDAPQTIGILQLGAGSLGGGYVLVDSGSNTLTFSNTAAGAPAQIVVADGTHEIDVPMVLASNLVVSSSGLSTGPWKLAFGTGSSITDNGNNLSLTLSDSDGTLILSGSNNYGGGTNVLAGTLVVAANNAIADGTAVSVGAGATLMFDSSQAEASPVMAGAAVNPVPEPGTLALFAAGAIGLIGYGCRGRRRPASFRV